MKGSDITLVHFIVAYKINHVHRLKISSFNSHC